MLIHIWKRLDKVSDNYHEGGGLVIFADSFERAKELALTREIDIKDYPDLCYEVKKEQEEIIVFPDAGCC